MKIGIISSKNFDHIELLESNLNLIKIDQIIADDMVGIPEYCQKNNISFRYVSLKSSKLDDPKILRVRQIIDKSDRIIVCWDGRDPVCNVAIMVAAKNCKIQSIIEG